ncbi:YfiR family protein [Entomohabitans teleogrylli]|uniref:YfiR family protein n=1 Tax=Entomohabitans teleogrylli TaxID=1384589 RepID=UPI00073D2715
MRFFLHGIIFISVAAFPIWPSVYAAENTAVANSVRTIVNGIVSYTRWPGLSNRLPRLCIFSSSSYADALSSPSSEAAQQNYTAVPVNNIALVASAHCDGFYFGRETPQQQMQLLEQLSPHPLLLIAENNPECLIGSAFCLNIKPGQVSFSVNLDSLTRSGIRVSPDVLMLARERNNHHE